MLLQVVDTETSQGGWAAVRSCGAALAQSAASPSTLTPPYPYKYRTNQTLEAWKSAGAYRRWVMQFRLTPKSHDLGLSLCS